MPLPSLLASDHLRLFVRGSGADRVARHVSTDKMPYAFSLWNESYLVAGR